MELLRALGALAEPPAPEHAAIAAALDLPLPTAGDHTDLFVLQLPPYASIYLGAEGMMGGEARERVAGFWRALGLAPPSEPDHLAALLGLAAALADEEAAEPDPARRRLRREARSALVWEHLLPWLPVYAARAEEIGPPAYRPWAALLRSALLTDLTPGSILPVHLREAPPLDRDDLDSFLAPARTGIVLARADLARIARAAGLGLRIGERRFVLRALLEQNAASTLQALAGEALAQARRWEADRSALGEIAGHWAGRAATTAGLLESLAAEAGCSRG